MLVGLRQNIYFKVLTAADDSETSYTFNITSGSNAPLTRKAAGVAFAVANVQGVPAFNSPASHYGSTSTIGSATIFAPSTTPTELDLLGFAVYGINNDVNLTMPAGYTEIGRASSTGNGAASRNTIIVAMKQLSTLAATGPLDVTSPASGDNCGMNIIPSRQP